MEYIRPQNMKDALKLMKRWRNRAEIVAGGTNVVPDLRARAIQPEILIDLSHLKTLSYIKEEKHRGPNWSVYHPFGDRLFEDHSETCIGSV